MYEAILGISFTLFLVSGPVARVAFLIRLLQELVAVKDTHSRLNTFGWLTGRNIGFVYLFRDQEVIGVFNFMINATKCW